MRGDGIGREAPSGPATSTRSPPSSDSDTIRVLQLYTSTRSFFENQLRALDGKNVEYTRLRVPGEYEPNAPRSVTDYARYLPAVLRESLGEYDLVHANYGLVAPFALAQPTRPVVLTLWGSDLMGERGWLRAVSRFGARHADAVILPSERMADDVSVEHDLVPFGIDTDRFRPISQQAARDHVGWDPDRQYVLFPYRSDRPEKDFERARRVIEAADVDVELMQIDGVDHAEMPYYYNASDALLLTSRRESGPMVVKEAAACNLPVVSTDVGFVDRVLEDVANSVVCDSDAELAGGLESVISSGQRSNGRSTLPGLGIDEMGDRLLDVYRRALADGNTDDATTGRSRTPV